MRVDQKGIATLDLIFASFIAILVFIVLISSASNLTDQSGYAGQSVAKLNAEKVATIITTAYNSGSGFSQNVTLENPSNGMSYQFTTTGDYLNVNAGSASYNIKIIPQSVNSVTMTNGNTYNILNNNGTIIITIA